MVLLFDIGNTNTHLGMANRDRVSRNINIPTESWGTGAADKAVAAFAGRLKVEGAVLCSVVPNVTPVASKMVKSRWGLGCLELTSKSVVGAGINYARPGTIGPDRVPNAVAARQRFGAPSGVV